MSVGSDYVCELRSSTGYCSSSGDVCVCGQPRWNGNDREKTEGLGEKYVDPSASLSTTNPKQTDPSANSCLYGDWTAADRLTTARSRVNFDQPVDLMTLFQLKWFYSIEWNGKSTSGYLKRNIYVAKEGEMGGACSAYEQKSTQHFGWKARWEKTTRKTSVHESMTLRWLLRNGDGRV